MALTWAHRKSLRFLVTSSIGVAHSWDGSRGRYAEDVLLDPSFTVSAGYSESKYVLERIITKSGLHATSLRIGQIAGGSNGSWATTDWFPILVKSSMALGALPDARGLLEKQAEGACSEDIAKAPAIKLLEYFRVMVQGDSDTSSLKTGSAYGDMNGAPLGEAGQIDTVKARRVSQTMAQMGV